VVQLLVDVKVGEAMGLPTALEISTSHLLHP